MIVLVGAGLMAQDHAKVLKAQKRPFKVVGRGDEKALAFEQAVGVPVIRGGLEKVLQGNLLQGASVAIVAVGMEALYGTTVQLITAGFRRILVEKPAGLNLGEIDALDRLAKLSGAAVYVAYNRRFYSSVRQARSIINEDGGLLSFTFEFTEWGHVIAGLEKAPGVKEHWVLANSSHVIDLAFFLGGAPAKMQAMATGGIDWHPAASQFVGSGITDKQVLFSYHANWEAPGRWGLEFCTANHRLFLRPMEKLHLMRKGSVEIELVDVAGADMDQQFKPGLFLQMQAFLDGDETDLCTLSNHRIWADSYALMAGYTSGAGNRKQ